MSRKSKRCCKRQILTSLLNCGNPNACYRNVKFAVQQAKTIPVHQKNRGVAAFLFEFCSFSLHCSWCSCLRHHYYCNRCKFDYLADKIGHSVANGSLPLRCFFQNCVTQALSRRDEPQRRHNKKTYRFDLPTAARVLFIRVVQLFLIFLSLL